MIEQMSLDIKKELDLQKKKSMPQIKSLLKKVEEFEETKLKVELKGNFKRVIKTNQNC